MVILGQRLSLMILEVFTNLDDSMKGVQQYLEDLWSADLGKNVFSAEGRAI